MALFGGDESALNIVLRLKDEASAKLKQIESRFSAFNKSMGPAVDASQKFALGLGAAGGAVVALGGFAIKAAADMEQTNIAFTTMLGSADKAKEFVQDLVNFAKTTPFELRGLQDASKQLLAYGFTQQEVIPNLKALGDVAAGVGMDKLPNLILAFGQVKAATKLTGMELRQFTEAGVPLLDELAKIMKKPVSEIQAMVSEGQIGFPIVQQALMNLTGEGGRFNDLMSKQAQSLGGMWSNLKDAWNIFLTGEGQKLIEWGKQLITVLIDIVQNHLPRWIAIIERIVHWFGEHKTAIYIVAGAILGALTPAIYAAVAAFAALALSLAPFIIGGAIIGGIVAGIVWVVKNWDMLKNKAREIWQAIADAIMSPIRAAIDFVQQQIDRVIAAFNKMKNIVTKPFQVAGNAVSNVVSGAKSLLGFDQGGTVPGPRGVPVPILAHGQERVIPAHQTNSSGSDKTININFDFSGATIADKDRLISEITRAINRGYRAVELGA